MENKTLAIVLVIVAVLGLMIFFITQKNKTDTMQSPSPVSTDTSIKTETTIPTTPTVPVAPVNPEFPQTGYQPK